MFHVKHNLQDQEGGEGGTGGGASGGDAITAL